MLYTSTFYSKKAPSCKGHDVLAQPYIQTLFSFSVASPGAGGGMEVGLRDIKIRCVTFTSLHGVHTFTIKKH